MQRRQYACHREEASSGYRKYLNVRHRRQIICHEYTYFMKLNINGIVFLSAKIFYLCF